MLANTSSTASFSSSSDNIRISSSFASPILSRSLLSTTKIRPEGAQVWVMEGTYVDKCLGMPRVSFLPFTGHPKYICPMIVTPAAYYTCKWATDCTFHNKIMQANLKLVLNTQFQQREKIEQSPYYYVSNVMCNFLKYFCHKHKETTLLP